MIGYKQFEEEKATKDRIPIPKTVFSNLKRLNELEDDWDGYGGKSISPVLTEKARNIIEILYSKLKNPLDSIWVGPTIEMGVQIDIKYKSRELEIEVNPNTNLISVLFSEIKQKNERIYHDEEIDPSQLDKVVTWLAL